MIASVKVGSSSVSVFALLDVPSEGADATLPRRCADRYQLGLSGLYEALYLSFNSLSST